MQLATSARQHDTSRACKSFTHLFPASREQFLRRRPWWRRRLCDGNARNDGGWPLPCRLTRRSVTVIRLALLRLELHQRIDARRGRQTLKLGEFPLNIMENHDLSTPTKCTHLFPTRRERWRSRRRRRRSYRRQRECCIMQIS